MRKILVLVLCLALSPAFAAEAVSALKQIDVSNKISSVDAPAIPEASDATPPDTGKGVPARPRFDANSAIMLQGFHWYADSYWYNPPNGWWGVLADHAAEVGKFGFNLIWFPPAAVGSYYPSEWYNLNGQWGKQDQLLNAIGAMHASGVKVIGDIIFNHRNGKTGWADFKNPDWPTNVIVQDDEWQGIAGAPHYGKSPNYDEGQGDWGCRDIDHRFPVVQQDAKKYLVWLRSLGFDGWRYDMVKGFPGYYVGMYNAASNPAFSVGEYYDTNRQALAGWADSTDGSAGKANASSVFDFTTRYNIVYAIESGHFEVLNDNGKPSGLIGWWPAKAVTFVDNHDTAPRDPAFMTNVPEVYRVQRMLGYAYILTHPGVPCVFWPHLFDWGDKYKYKIAKLVEIRRNAGITATSPVQILNAEYNLYTSITYGQKQKVALKLGSSWRWSPGPGWYCVESGDNYAIWVQ